MESSDTHRAIEAVWRIESARLIAGLAHIVRDVGLAEDLAQDALVIALERWPETGIPNNPGAWLMATAKNRAIDGFRRSTRLERKHEELGRELEIQQEISQANFDTAPDDDDADASSIDAGIESVRAASAHGSGTDGPDSVAANSGSRPDGVAANGGDEPSSLTAGAPTGAAEHDTPESVA